MADEVTTTTTTPAGGGEAPKAETPKTPAAAAPPAKEPAAAAPAGKEPAAEPAKGKAHRITGDDEIPENAELLELSSSALKKRLDRNTKKELRDRFGTDDVDQIKKDLEELKTLRTEKETTRRASLDEQARLKEDLKKMRAERDQARTQASEVRLNHEIEREDVGISRVAEKHVDAEYLDVAMGKFAAHLKAEYTDKELEALTGAKKDKVIEKFFADFVEKHPKLAREAVAAAEEERPKVNATNGADTRAGRPGSTPSAPSGATGQKTFKPGQPNSMTRTEARAEAKRLGYHY